MKLREVQSFRCLLALLAVSLALEGCTTISSQPPVFSSDVQAMDQETDMSPTNRIFKAGDELKISVPLADVPGLVYEGRIKEDGTIILPLIGSVHAAGTTPAELSNELHRSYSRVPEFGSRMPTPPHYHDPIYFVGGEVRNPNRHAWNGTLTVWRAIQVAGGLTDWANGKKVKLTRADGQSEVLNILKAAKDEKFDRPVYPGDKIFVPRKGLF